MLLNTAMNIPYNIEVHDNLISPEIHKKTYLYVKTRLDFTGVWQAEKEVVFNYGLGSPKSPNDWMAYQSFGRAPRMHRSALSSDEESLKILHPQIFLLWQEINRSLGNQFELTGHPEGMTSNIKIPDTADPDLEPGWRSYVNLVYNSHAGHGGNGSPHRDTPLEYNDTTSVTMLYVLNNEWYPSWGAELKYYPEDPDGSTGDHQQFSLDPVMQHRDYNIGWLDRGRVVSPVPGRLIIYDGRCLHCTSPAAGPLDNPSIKIAFRARRKQPV
jgi:hypothetical protein